MIIAKSCHRFLLYTSILSLALSLGSGCAGLPNVAAKIDQAPTAQQPLQILSSKGLLSPEKSRAIMEVREHIRPLAVR